MPKRRLQQLFDAEDLVGLKVEAEGRPRPVLRFLMGRLYGEHNRRAVRLLGGLVADAEPVPVNEIIELLRRFFWALNDESGAVPFGIPEAIGEILAQRPELQDTFLPMLCALLTAEDMSQTGAIERGAIWALGRVGAPVAACCAEAVGALEHLAEHHPEPQTRQVATDALQRIGGR